MKRRPASPSSESSTETTRELTGFDATPAEAEIGSAPPNGMELEADLSGGYRDIEDEAFSDDILPDQLRQITAEETGEDANVTARPTERPDADEVHLRWRLRDERPGFSSPDSEMP